MKNYDELLAACLDATRDYQAIFDEYLSTHPEEAPELASAIGVAQRCRQAPQVRATDTFRHAARQRLLAEIGTGQAAAIKVQTHPTVSAPVLQFFAPKLARVAAAAAIVAVLLVGTGIAAVQAAPESPLFPLRLSLEETRLVFVSDQTERVQLRLAMVEQRSLELAQLAVQPQTQDIEATASRYEDALQVMMREIAPVGGMSTVTGDVANVLNEEQVRFESTLRNPAIGLETRTRLEMTLRTLETERLRLQINHPQSDTGHPASGTPVLPLAPSMGEPDQERERLQERDHQFDGVQNLTPTPAGTIAAPRQGTNVGEPAAILPGQVTPVGNAVQQQQQQQQSSNPTATPVHTASNTVVAPSGQQNSSQGEERVDNNPGTSNPSGNSSNGTSDGSSSGPTNGGSNSSSGGSSQNGGSSSTGSSSGPSGSSGRR